MDYHRALRMALIAFLLAAAPAGAESCHGIDGLEKGKSVKVCIARVDPADAVFAHENSRVCIVHEIPGEPGQFPENLGSDQGVTIGRTQKSQTG